MSQTQMNSRDLRKIKMAGQRYSLDERYRGVSEATANQRDPQSISVKSITPKLSTAAGTNDAELSNVDLTQIGQAYYSDSYISRAINKIIGLMFKAGWSFSSLNKEALSYIETRFRLMEESTGIKTNELLRELGLNYVLYGNGILVKTRGSENMAGLTYQGYYESEPVNGLFVANPEYFSIVRDDNGNTEGYNVGEDNSAVQFGKYDILHMTYQKPSGLSFGVPYITNTIRDVLVLRQIEQTVTNILYRNLHPLQTYTVGLAEPGFEAREGEIEEVVENIQNASLDSMFVLPERHSIKSVSTDYLDANGYLKYFRQRVFTGLGVSESTMGVGDTANRSTSDNQSSDLIDLVKDFQQNFAYQFQKLVDEILFEGGYDPTLNEDDRVEFVFTEIEHGTKIARENHEIQKFLQNTQGLNQTRQNMGYEPTNDYSDFYSVLFKETASTGTVDNKNQPENQYGKQDSPSESISIEKESKFKSIKEHTDLTNPDKEVNLFSDDEKNMALKQAWDKTIDKISKHESYGQEFFEDTFHYYLNQSLFENENLKKHFVKLISKQVCEENQFNIKSNNLHLFDKSISGSYEAFNKLIEEGAFDIDGV